MSFPDQRATAILERVVREVVSEGRPYNPGGWPAFRDLLASHSNESGAFFDRYKAEILEIRTKYAEGYGVARINPPLSPPNSLDGNAESMMNGLGSMPRPGTEVPPVPITDPLKPEPVSISINFEIKNGDAWAGVRACWGMRKESFIHERIVQRHKLPTEDGRAELTWSLGDNPVSYRTVFLVVSTQDILFDCMLGTHCRRDQGQSERDNDEYEGEESSQPPSNGFGGLLPRNPTQSYFLPMQDTFDAFVGRASAHAYLEYTNLCQQNRPPAFGDGLGSIFNGGAGPQQLPPLTDSRQEHRLPPSKRQKR